MPNTRTITAANSVLIISTDQFGLHRLQGFGTDAITETEALSQVEVLQGVDGRTSFGYVPVPTIQRFTLQADSLSCDYMDTLVGQQEQNREVILLTGSLFLPAINKKFAMRRGAVTNYMKFPNAQRTLVARAWTMTWEAVTPSPN